MKQNIIKPAFTTAILLLLFRPVFAQHSNFTGTWLQKEKKSLTGPDYLNGIATKLTVQPDKNELVIQRTSPTGDTDNPEITQSETLPLDGKPGISTTADQKKKTASLKFDSGGASFTESATINDPDAGVSIFKTTEVWSLSPDGKTLTLIKSFQSTSDPNDKWSMKGFYEKQ